MKKLTVLIVLVIFIKLIISNSIIQLNDEDDDRDGDGGSGYSDGGGVDSNNFRIDLRNFHKIFKDVRFITIAIENRKLFDKIVGMIGLDKTYFVINYKYCYNHIINVHTNYFINSYYESDDSILGRKRRKRETNTKAADDQQNGINKNLSFHNIINLNNKNYGGFIFEITDLNILNYIINCYLTPGGIYLFIINSNDRTSDYSYEDFLFGDDMTSSNNGDIHLDDITNLFNEIWTNYQNYKIFIYLNNQIITYNPFYYNFTVKSYGKLIINASDRISDDQFLSEINLKRLNGYPLKIEIFPSTYVVEYIDRQKKQKHFVGADIEVAKTLRNVMNYTGIKQTADIHQFGFRLPNGTFTGTLSHLIRHSSDVSINGFFIKDYLTRDVEFTTAVYADKLCLIVPKANRIPSSLLPLRCFKTELWVMILLVMIGASIFWCMIRRINETNKFKRIYEQTAGKRSANSNIILDRFNRSVWIVKHKPFQYYQIFVDTLMLMTSAPMRRFTKVTTERCFIITLCLISLVFVSIFQSKLATIFIEPIYYKDILTLKDMERSHLKIAVKYPAMMDDMFPPNSSRLMDNLRKQLYLVNPRYASITSQMYRDKQLASATRQSKTKLDNAIYVTNLSFFLVPECPKSYMLAYAVAKDSVYLEPINDILLHLLNGGIIDKWINDMYYNQTLSDIRTYGIFYVAKFKTLILSDLELAFMILGCGIVLSAVMFLIELNIKKTYVIQKADMYQYGFHLPNGTTTGTLGHVIRRTSDIAVIGLFIKDYLTRGIEFTVAVYTDKLCLLVPKAKRIPSSLLPMLCFKSETWAVILAVFIIASIFWCAIRRINNYWPIVGEMDRFNRAMWVLIDRRRQYYQIFVDTLMLIVSAPMRRFTRVSSERCFIITLCIISLIFVSLFQSKLATVFIEPVYYKDIVTLQDMGESNLKVAIKYPAMMDDMFPANSTPLINKIRQQLFLVDTTTPSTTAIMMRDRSMATVIRMSKTRLDMAIAVTNQSIFVVPECPKIYNLAYLLAKNSIFLEPVNEILLHLLNGGLINKWIRDMYFNQTLANNRVYGTFNAAKFKILTLYDMLLAFNILAIGTVGSAILFMVELRCNKICIDQ